MRKTKVLGRKRSVFHFLFCLLYFEGTNLISNKRPCTRRPEKQQRSRHASGAVGRHNKIQNSFGLGSGRQMLRERDGPHREGEEPKPMMHGHEKSDLVIVAVKPTNKAKKAPCGGVCGGGRSGVGGANGGGQGEYAPAKHVLDSEPGSRVTGAGAYTATCAVTHPRQEPYAGKPHVRFCAGGVP